MANENVSADRALIALRCAWEIQAWSTLIAQRVDREDMDAPDMWLRGAALRLDQLASVVMTACTPGEKIEPAEHMLLGPGYMRARPPSALADVEPEK